MRARRFIAAMATATSMTVAGLTLGALVPGTALSSGVAAAATSDEAGFLSLTNQARASVGAPSLSLDGSLTSVARSWAQSMAAQGGISHNPDLGSAVDGWSRLGENVGVGANVAQVHAALLASPTHYQNLTNPGYSLVGIGVVSAGGRIWVVEDFETPAGGGRSTVTADPEPEPAPAPAPVVVPRATPTTEAPPPPTTRPAPAPATPPPPDAGASTVPFVLNALRALDSAYNR